MANLVFVSDEFKIKTKLWGDASLLYYRQIDAHFQLKSTRTPFIFNSTFTNI